MQISGFHATNHELLELNYEELLKNIDDHDNGALGVWCADRTSWIKSFGKAIYKVSLEGKNYDMGIDELSKLSEQFSSAVEYTAKRNELLSQGFDFIRIVETDGHSNMFVVLSFDKAEVEKLIDG